MKYTVVIKGQLICPGKPSEKLDSMIVTIDNREAAAFLQESSEYAYRYILTHPDYRLVDYMVHLYVDAS